MRIVRGALLGLPVLGGGPASDGAALPGDGSVRRGAEVFGQCGACRAVAPGVHLAGPSLARWLTNPQALVPGNVMTLPGLKDAQQRADLVAYLKAVAAAAVEQAGFRIEADGRRARGGDRLFSARRDGASA
jgi:hypothetical protein